VNDLSKEDQYVLRGKLVRKPRSGFSYGQTRKVIVEQLLTFEINEKHEKLFDRIGNVKIDEEKIDIPVKMNKHFLGARDELTRQQKVSEMLIRLEQHFGIGTGLTAEEEAATDKRLDEMDKLGIIPIAYLTELEEKDFDT
jgi:hypothetical protein